MKANPIEINVAAEEFKKSAEETNQMVNHLSEVIKNLDQHWSETSQQRFYIYFEEWRNQMDGFSQVLEVISQELSAIAYRYAEADDVGL